MSNSIRNQNIDNNQTFYQMKTALKYFCCCFNFRKREPSQSTPLRLSTPLLQTNSQRQPPKPAFDNFSLQQQKSATTVLPNVQQLQGSPCQSSKSLSLIPTIESSFLLKKTILTQHSPITLAFLLKQLNKRMQGGDVVYCSGNFSDANIQMLARGLVHLFIIGEEVEALDRENTSWVRAEKKYVGKVAKPIDRVVLDLRQHTFGEIEAIFRELVRGCSNVALIMPNNMQEQDLCKLCKRFSQYIHEVEMINVKSDEANYFSLCFNQAADVTITLLQISTEEKVHIVSDSISKGKDSPSLRQVLKTMFQNYLTKEVLKIIQPNTTPGNFIRIANAKMSQDGIANEFGSFGSSNNLRDTRSPSPANSRVHHKQFKAIDEIEILDDIEHTPMQSDKSIPFDLSKLIVGVEIPVDEIQ